jgi:fatty acid desaturase
VKWPRELRHPLFLVGTVLYLLVAVQKHGGTLFREWLLPDVVRFHLADLLALPLELTLLLYFMRRWYFRRPSFVLPASWIVGTWVVFALWFEVLLPLFDHRATADPLDVVAYGVGGILFWCWLNQPA